MTGATLSEATSAGTATARDLDAGPNTEQDVVRVTRRLGVDEMVQAGRDMERTVSSLVFA